MEISPDQTGEQNQAEAARKALRILQVHAAHQKQVRAARKKLAAEVQAHLTKMGAPSASGGEWPALASAQKIISGLPSAMQDDILSRLPEEIREEVVELLYAFAAIPRHPARSVQRLLREVDSRTIATALIGADKSIHEAITANMSRRAATMLEEDIESLIKAGDLSTRDVREARRDIGGTLYRLYEEGELGGQPDE